MLDYNALNEMTINEDLYNEKGYDFSFLCELIPDIISNNPIINDTKVQAFVWDKRFFPRKAKMPAEERYKKEALRVALRYSGYELKGYCEISIPLFTENRNAAILKVDYSMLRMNNGCTIKYLFFAKKENVWKRTYTVGGGECMF